MSAVFLFWAYTCITDYKGGHSEGGQFLELAHFLKIYPMESNSKNFL